MFVDSFELIWPTCSSIEEEDKRIAQARTDSIKEFRDIGLLFKTAVEEAGNLSQTGVEAAKEYVDIFHQVVAQTIDEEDLKDLTDCLGHSTQILLESANSMHEKLKSVRLRLGVVGRSSHLPEHSLMHDISFSRHNSTSLSASKEAT